MSAPPSSSSSSQTPAITPSPLPSSLPSHPSTSVPNTSIPLQTGITPLAPTTSTPTVITHTVITPKIIPPTATNNPAPSPRPMPTYAGQPANTIQLRPPAPVNMTIPLSNANTSTGTSSTPHQYSLGSVNVNTTIQQAVRTTQAAPTTPSSAGTGKAQMIILGALPHPAPSGQRVVVLKNSITGATQTALISSNIPVSNLVTNTTPALAKVSMTIPPAKGALQTAMAPVSSSATVVPASGIVIACPQLSLANTLLVFQSSGNLAAALPLNSTSASSLVSVSSSSTTSSLYASQSSQSSVSAEASWTMYHFL